MDNLSELFSKIKKILENNSSNYLTTEKTFGSQAKQNKPGYHLYGKKEVSLFGKKPKPTYIAGVIQQKHYVSFYLSPIYSHPDLYPDINPELKKVLKGKSCFNIKKATPQLLNEIEDVLTMGIKKYKELDWI